MNFKTLACTVLDKQRDAHTTRNQYALSTSSKLGHNKGPRTVPYGTPDKTGAQSDFAPFKTTHCCL